MTLTGWLSTTTNMYDDNYYEQLKDNVERPEVEREEWEREESYQQNSN